MGRAKARLVIIVGLVVFLLLGVLPPWYVGKGGEYLKYVGYAPIFSPPPPKNYIFENRIDTTRLVVQLIVVGVCTGVVYWIVRKKD